MENRKNHNGRGRPPKKKRKTVQSAVAHHSSASNANGPESSQPSLLPHPVNVDQMTSLLPGMCGSQASADRAFVEPHPPLPKSADRVSAEPEPDPLLLQSANVVSAEPDPLLLQSADMASVEPDPLRLSADMVSVEPDRLALHLQSADRVSVEPDPLHLQSADTVSVEPDPLLLQSADTVSVEPDPLLLQSADRMSVESDPLLLQSTDRASVEPDPLLLQSADRVSVEPDPLLLQSADRVSVESDPLLLQSTDRASVEPDPLLLQSADRVSVEPDPLLLQSADTVSVEPDPLLLLSADRESAVRDPSFQGLMNRVAVDPHDALPQRAIASTARPISVHAISLRDQRDAGPSYQPPFRADNVEPLRRSLRLIIAAEKAHSVAHSTDGEAQNPSPSVRPVSPGLNIGDDASIAVAPLPAPRAARTRAANQLPLARQSGVVPQEADCGNLSVECCDCGALHFPGEVKQKNRINDREAKFSDCCNLGRIHLDPIVVPDLLKGLLEGQDHDSAKFRKNIRNYNNAMAFASMVANLDNFRGRNRGPYSYRVHGQVYHVTGCLVPQGEEDQHRFAQLYLLDSDSATELRIQQQPTGTCEAGLLRQLSELISEINPLARSYRMMKTIADQELTENSEVMMIFDIQRSLDLRRYNCPVRNEIAAVFVSPDGEVPTGRTFVVRHKDGRLQRLKVTDPLVDPMTYPLFFPTADPGWSIDFKLQTKATMMRYYAYRLAIRRNGFSPIHYGGKLFQQFIVDAYCKVEEERLNYIRYNQPKLRVDTYENLTNYLENLAGEQNARLGQKVVLPSTFQGSPRCMAENYRDAMAMVSKMGKPDLFLTFTCNPSWKEIRENLLPGQQPSDRPDLVARIFKQKFDALREDLFNKHVIGVVRAYVAVIEFQKRGLPHAHVLITLAHESKLTTPEEIDATIRAELPDPEQEPELHAAVLRHMIHGPCGAVNPNSPCMTGSACSKDFPKPYEEATRVNVNGYPRYKRRDSQLRAVVRGTEVTNGWVVPYNPWLLLKYNAHINVESCASIKSVKYIYKYIYKGHDCASVRVTTTENIIEHNEVSTYLNARYVGAPEAAWRLFGYPLQYKSHTVKRLDVHLPNRQSVFFNEGEERGAHERAAERNSTLTAYFQLNEQCGRQRNNVDADPNDKTDSRNYLYTDIPTEFTWYDRERQWKPRKQHRGELGRMHFAQPSEGERYYLRLLLLHRKGARSFQDLRTVEGVSFETFREAAKQLRLTSDDQDWHDAMQEASQFKTPSQLRRIFVDFLIFCTPTDPERLWNSFKLDMAEDYIIRYGDEVRSLATTYRDLVDIAKGRVAIEAMITRPCGDPLPAETAEVDISAAISKGNTMYNTLNAGQRKAADKVLKAVEGRNSSNGSKWFFIDGPGGSGKTYLYETLNHMLKGKGLTIINVAWCGIAAQLLPQGRTAHSAFKLPVPVPERKFAASIPYSSKAADVLRAADVIIWDEAPMSPRYAVEAVDELLQDLHENEELFGGKVILMGGDFRQIPPVVTGRGDAATLEASLKRSRLWPKFTKLKLDTNMRAGEETAAFRDYLLRIGEGREPVDSDGNITIPEQFRSSSDIVREIYGDRLDPENDESIVNRAILCPTNVDALEINETVLKLIPGNEKAYYSVDEAVTDDDSSLYPIEFLNSLTPAGMPPHSLNLKVGAVVVLLRNLSIEQGLCNGTRLVVKHLVSNIIQCRTLEKDGPGKDVLIPRIDLCPSDLKDLPFKLKRRQFPLRLAFAMTINKSQGQTFHRVGVSLSHPVFSHGQLYVAFSRCTTARHLKVWVPDAENSRTKNVVLSELLS